MTVPASYASEAALASYMLGVLGDVGKDLGISMVPTAEGVPGDFAEPINDVLLTYGADTVGVISGTESVAKLRAIARVYAWRLALSRAAARYDFSDGTQSLKRSQVFSQIKSALAQAESDAAALGVGTAPVVKVGSISYIDDPYRAIGV